MEELPPSVDSKEDAKWWSSLSSNDSFQYDVTYSITTSGYSNRGLIASAVQKLSVLPVTGPQPPAYGSDSSGEPGEFFLATTRRQPKARKRTGSPRYVIAAQEPATVGVDATGHAQQSSVEIPLTMKLLPRDDGRLERGTLPTQFNLKARMATRTDVTPDGRKSSATADRSRGDDDHTRTFRSNEQDFTISIPSWSLHGEDPTERFAIAKLPFIFSLDAARKMSPTFFTPILSRRHTIELTLSFPSSSSVLELSVPLQAMHEAGEIVLPLQKQFRELALK